MKTKILDWKKKKNHKLNLSNNISEKKERFDNKNHVLFKLIYF